jgi:hypothetical protein
MAADSSNVKDDRLDAHEKGGDDEVYTCPALPLVQAAPAVVATLNLACF